MVGLRPSAAGVMRPPEGLGMKLYDGGKAPNPRRTRIFLAEKGITVPTEQVDIMAQEHKTADFTAKNPLQRVPVLVLDDGTCISESIAICRYFEALRPEPPLFGPGALEAAMVEMWNRRAELNFLFIVAHAFRHLHPAMKELEVPQVAEWGEANKPRAVDFLRILDRELGDHEFVAGDRYTVADITTMVGYDFLKVAKIAVPEELIHVRRWHATVSARPSAGA
jgi:glutathione S-transferase